MSLAELKVFISQRIFDTGDLVVLKKVLDLLDEEYPSLLDDMPESVRLDLELSLKELDEGLGVPNDEVFKRVKKKWDTKSGGLQEQSNASNE
jgi:hypothetical protein